MIRKQVNGMLSHLFCIIYRIRHYLLMMMNSLIFFGDRLMYTRSEQGSSTRTYVLNQMTRFMNFLTWTWKSMVGSVLDIIMQILSWEVTLKVLGLPREMENIICNMPHRVQNLMYMATESIWLTIL